MKYRSNEHSKIHKWLIHIMIITSVLLMKYLVDMHMIHYINLNTQE